MKKAPAGEEALGCGRATIEVREGLLRRLSAGDGCWREVGDFFVSRLPHGLESLLIASASVLLVLVAVALTLQTSATKQKHKRTVQGRKPQSASSDQPARARAQDSS